jgi:hypothetical protein
LILLGVEASGAAPESSPPPDYRPPDTKGICPGLALDYELCSDDPWSGNCAGFVTAAGRLGEVYRSELREHPGWGPDLQAANWWGCGSAGLGELRSLLERIDTPQARAVLAEEPYRAPPEPPAPVPRLPPHQELDCLSPSTEAERDACAARGLAGAKVQHERFFDACNKKLAPALRQELLEAETSWLKLLPLECGGAPPTRDACLARAYAERTQSIASRHTECAAAGTK